MRIIAFVLLFLGLMRPAEGKVLYVSVETSTNGVADGGSWKTAFATVQAGLDAAVLGDEIWGVHDKILHWVGFLCFLVAEYRC